MARNSFGERYAERQKNGVAWHAGANTKRLEGTGTNASSALEVAELDFPVVTIPAEYPLPGGKRMTSDISVGIFRPVLAEDIAEDPSLTLGEYMQVGTAGGDFTPVTNRELCAMLDPLTEKYGWEVETIGALKAGTGRGRVGKGVEMFITLDSGTAEIGGDTIRQFFFVWSKNDGTSALSISVTPVRVVCQNTCITGLQSANITASIHHTKRVHEEAKLAIDLVARLRAAQQGTMEALNNLTKFTLTNAEVSAILETVYPLKPEPPVLERLTLPQGVLTPEEIAALTRQKARHEDEIAASLEGRVLAFQSYLRFNDESRAMARTGWSLYNAVTEAENWKEGGNDRQWVKSVMQGERAHTMKRAFAAIATAKA